MTPHGGELGGVSRSGAGGGAGGGGLTFDASCRDAIEDVRSDLTETGALREKERERERERERDQL